MKCQNGKNVTKFGKVVQSLTKLCKIWQSFAKKPFSASTLFYKSLILRDLTMGEASAFHAHKIGGSPEVRDAIILLKIWSHMREMGNTFEGFNSHVINCHVVNLLQTGEITNAMTIYDIIKTVWESLGKRMNNTILYSNKTLIYTLFCQSLLRTRR